MAQRAVESITPNRPPQPTPRPLPSLGMRGGLGKTLLIAFLLLAIVPLSLLALLTYQQIQRDTGHKLLSALETVVALKEAHLLDWIQSYERELGILAGVLGQGADQAAQLRTMQAIDPALTGLILMDLDTGEVLASTGVAGVDPQILQPLLTGEQRLVVADPPAGSHEPLLAIRHAWDNWLLIGLLSWEPLRQMVTAFDGPGDAGTSRLVTSEGWMLSADGLSLFPSPGREGASPGIVEILRGQNGSGAYTSLEGVPVFGAYRWSPELQVGILAERSQLQALAAGNAQTALIVGATLAVALVTSALAAIVTRRITRPIVQLTETAAWMARGDLNQRVRVDRRDEIGVLARAFNRMAAELRVLYESLEAKVAERTTQLEEANEQTRYYLMQLATSAEVARVATSIRDLDQLLSTVVTLIDRTFELQHTSIYLLDDSGQWARWQVGSREPRPLSHRVRVGAASLVGRVAADGRRRVVQSGDPNGQIPAVYPEEGFEAPVVSEMAVPLRVRERILGVLDLQSRRSADFGENEQVVYQSLADQISIAIENARAYAAERETVERLRELDRIQAEFLTHMSHALRTPLNTIIGFSRILVKELDGPLNEVQRSDLDAIYESGRQLLGLINDMLELSQLELGVAPFAKGEVDLVEIIEGVMVTTRALARGKSLQLYEEVPADLPKLQTDGQRVRQVILALLSNAVKFTAEGSIHLRVTTEDGHVTISVEDSGVGISREERERIFSEGWYHEAEDDNETPGFGLAISKRVVEKLGGRIWMESEEGVGSTFSFTLPIKLAEVGQIEVRE